MPKPRKTTGSKDLGRAIIKRAAQDRRNKRSEGTGFHVADLERSNNPLQSVTEASSLEEFMAAASMADRSFTAEKANIRFVSDEPALPPRGAVRGGAFGPVSAPSIRDVESGTLRNMRIPRRPKWDGKTSAEQLHRAEKDAFLEWRRQLAQAELEHGAGLATADAAGLDGTVASMSSRGGEVTPFEKNLEVWRQLWRVVERSDVLVQIVDARNPLMFRCPDLEEYVREVNPGKRCLLVLNKADYLSPSQRLAWARYFTARGLDFVFFSAKREQQRLEAQDRVQQQRVSVGRLPGLGPVPEDRPYDSEEDGAGSEAGGGHEDGQDDGSDAGAGSLPASSKAGRSAAAASRASAKPLSVSDIAARHAARKQAARDRRLAAAMAQALRLDSDSEDSDSDSEEEGKEARAAARQARKDRRAASAAALIKAAQEAARQQDEEDEGDDEDEEQEEEDEHVDIVDAPSMDAVDAAVDALMTIKDDGNAGLDPADPLYSKCTVLTRDALLDFFHSHYEDIPRGALGSGDEQAQQRKAEWIARKRAEAKAARQAELAKRREQVQRMIEVGLGAHVRFGDEADARALDEEDEAEDDDEDGEDGAGPGEDEPRPPLLVGMVGYPNVGKSSTINALLGATAGNHLAKRVAVASTPGKTKHFQTLTLDDDITLCDCPGLVFPSFVVTREEMVVNGVLPIDNMRDHVSPVRLLCQRIPRAVLERYYGIKLASPGPGQAANRQPTAAELLDAFCKARGFAAQGHGGYDHPRGSRLLLKDYCEGRLVYAHPPPGGWASWAAQAGLAPVGPPAPVDPSTSGSSSATAKPSSNSSSSKVNFADNVLLPRVQKRHEGPVLPAAVVAAAAVAPVPAPQQASAVPPAPVHDEDEEDSDVSSDDHAHAHSDHDDDESDSDSVDEAELLSFAKVVVVRKAKKDGQAQVLQEDEEADEDEEDDEYDGSNAAAGAGGAQPRKPRAKAAGQRQADKARQAGSADDDDEEEEEGDGAYVATVYQGAAIAEAAAVLAGGKAKEARAPRERGLGRHGRKKKGERDADPYGTAAAADAASRRYYAAEIAAVVSGPANEEAGPEGEVELVPDVATVDHQANGAKRAGAPQAKAGHTNAGKAASKVTYDAGGAMVMDAVPLHLRGQQPVPVPVAVPRSLLKKKLELSRKG